MKHYKDYCHHYKVLDNHRAITVTNLKGYCASIGFEDLAGIEHFIIKYIKDKTVKPCTEKQYQNAFDKALNTINKLK